MAAVVAGASIIGESGAEGKWKGVVFMEERVSAVAVVEGKGGGRDVLGDPVRVARLAVEGGEVGWGTPRPWEEGGEGVKGATSSRVWRVRMCWIRMMMSVGTDGNL